MTLVTPHSSVRSSVRSSVHSFIQNINRSVPVPFRMAGTVAETVAGTERFIFQFDFTERLRRVRCLPESLTGGTRSNGGRLADGGGVPMFAGIADRPEAGRGATRARRVRWWRRNQGGGRLAGIGAGLADAFRRLETGLQGRGTAGRRESVRRGRTQRRAFTPRFRRWWRTGGERRGRIAG